MINKGKITSWNDNKGFGFITPSSGEERVFAHIKAFKYQGRRPEVDRLVTYTLSKDKQGRNCAAEIVMSAAPIIKKTGHGNSNFSALLAALFLFIIGAYIGWGHFSRSDDSAAFTNQNDTVLSGAFNERLSGVQAESSGTVIKILSDDNEGSRHQRFILKLQSGQTLLIAHNIDLAPRLSNLREGDTVAFNGEYEWNSKGGVIHWTHHDPNGYHEAGWLKHNSQTYQ